MITPVALVLILTRGGTAGVTAGAVGGGVTLATASVLGCGGAVGAGLAAGEGSTFSSAGDTDGLTGTSSQDVISSGNSIITLNSRRTGNLPTSIVFPETRSTYRMIDLSSHGRRCLDVGGP